MRADLFDQVQHHTTHGKETTAQYTAQYSTVQYTDVEVATGHPSPV
jgi:hypothetical protein